ncbi:Protein of unknown function [Citreimonas salinaria]|uniref:DUF998 domain-containing protein n=2 Tax=Citreimonas salinaria TaxID=321339 RepID=A0A1H3J380_9RHOB|nr:Protein of unknown function [Citreimonas salinaria]
MSRKPSRAADPLDMRPDATLLRICAIVGALGVAALIASNIVGSVLVPGHDWVSDTVSDLAAGEFEIIQDVGFYGFAGGLFAIALGLAHMRLSGTRMTVTILSLAVLTGIVIIVGARNEYGDNDNEGVVIHIYLVYALGLLFLAAFAAPIPAFRDLSRNLSRISFLCAILWAIMAPIFFIMPTAYDGAWERALGLVAAFWVAAVSHEIGKCASRES